MPLNKETNQNITFYKVRFISIVMNLIFFEFQKNSAHLFNEHFPNFSKKWILKINNGCTGKGKKSLETLKKTA